MNTELDEVVVQEVSDDALELAAGCVRGGPLQGGFNQNNTLIVTAFGCLTW